MMMNEAVPIAAPQLGAKEKAAVNDVLDSGQLAANGKVTEFENAFAEYCNTTHGIATSNGTTALHAALNGLGIGEGDTVLTTPFTFIATANAIRFTGAEPLFADINPATFNLDPDAVQTTIKTSQSGVDAILAVHLYGLPAPLNHLADIADTHDIPLIEDCAQAHGAKHKNRPVGSIGDIGCFSFYPTKNMTTAEGGMIVTDRADISEDIRRFIDHGRTGTYEHSSVGHNFRLHDIAAAIGCVQLERLPNYVNQRRIHAEKLTAELAETTVTPPDEPDDYQHAYNQYTIRSNRRESLRHHLDDAGIGTGVYYPTPIHHQPPYQTKDCSAPAAEQASNEVLSLPVHPNISLRDVEAISTAIKSFEI